MTLDQIVKIQSVIDKRAIRSDTLEFLECTRYSESTKKDIRYGDMHIDHFIAAYKLLSALDEIQSIMFKEKIRVKRDD